MINNSVSKRQSQNQSNNHSQSNNQSKNQNQSEDKEINDDMLNNNNMRGTNSKSSLYLKNQSYNKHPTLNEVSDSNDSEINAKIQQNKDQESKNSSLIQYPNDCSKIRPQHPEEQLHEESIRPLELTTEKIIQSNHNNNEYDQLNSQSMAMGNSQPQLHQKNKSMTNLNINQPNTNPPNSNQPNNQPPDDNHVILSDDQNDDENDPNEQIDENLNPNSDPDQDPEQNIDHSMSMENLSNLTVKEDAKAKCMKIFYHFAKFSPEDKDFYISQQTIIKILKAINIFEKTTLKLSNLDLILKNISPKVIRLNSKQFLNMIVKIAEKIDFKNYKQDPKESVLNVMNTFFEPFAKEIDNRSRSSNHRKNDYSPLINVHSACSHGTIENKLESLDLDLEIVNSLTNICHGLKEIYTSYFCIEKHSNDIDRTLSTSLSNILEFAKDFEITPFQISVSQLVVYWNSMLNMKIAELTKEIELPEMFNVLNTNCNMFSFNKFCLLIVHLAITIFNKDNHEDVNSNFKNNEKLILFLSKLENSKGYKNLSYCKTFKPATFKTKLIPKINQANGKQTGNGFNVSCSFTKENHKENNNHSEINTDQLRLINDKIKTKDYKNLKLSDILSVNQETIDTTIIQNEQAIKNLFESYCSIGDKICSYKLTQSSYLKFLKECNLISELENNHTHKNYKGMNSQSVRSAYTDTNQNEEKKKKLQKIASKVKIENTPTAKLPESEATLIFISLTGYKHFDSNARLSGLKDGNKGSSLFLNESGKGSKFDVASYMQGNKLNCPFKMNYNLFIKSFELLAVKLHPYESLDGAFTKFINEDIQKVILEKSESPLENTKILKYVENFKENNIITTLISDLYSVIAPHYYSYSDNFGLMSLENFFQFLKDFLIFPQFTKVAIAKTIFYSLSQFFEDNLQEVLGDQIYLMEKTKLIASPNKIQIGSENPRNLENAEKRLKNHIGEIELINVDLFIDSLILIALQYEINDSFNEIEKIVYLFEKMCQSDGISKSQLRSGAQFTSGREFTHALSFIKNKYHEFLTIEQQLNASFDQIFEN